MTRGIARTGIDDLITYYDDATGERTGLTAVEVGDWAAATAALLTAGCRLGPDRQAAVLLPPHWQTATVLLGAWSAGVSVSFRGWSTAGLTPAGAMVDVSFVERRRIGNWLDDVPAAAYQFVLGLAPDGAPTADVPPGYDDYLPAARLYLGSAVPPTTRPGDRATADGSTYDEYGTLAADVAARNGIRRGDRLLIDAASQEQPLTWLLAPLSVGASVVLCANLDRTRLDSRIAAERVTRVF